jgi:CBS domain containing-hemolysin-like protein
VVALSVVMYLHVVVGEMVPKNIALAGPERAALVLGPPIMAVVTVLRPVVATLNAVANGVVRLLRVQPKEEVASAFSRDEVAEMVRESREQGLIGQDEYARLEGALGFTERSVTAVLLRPEALVTVPADATVGAVEEVCARTGYSRFPVTSADGALTGYLHVKDVLQTDPSGADLPLQGKWVRPFATVRPRGRLHDALAALRERGAHMGRVVDDDGTVLGVVTLEDVLEELVGEIRDAAHP